MRKTKVVVIRCDTYADDQVLTAIQRGLDLLGGIPAFVRSGERIVMKPNILIGKDPDKGVTTHPAVFKAVGKLLKEDVVRIALEKGLNLISITDHYTASWCDRVVEAAHDTGFTVFRVWKFLLIKDMYWPFLKLLPQRPSLRTY